MEGECTPGCAGQVLLLLNFPVCLARTWHFGQSRPVFVESNFGRDPRAFGARTHLPPVCGAGAQRCVSGEVLDAIFPVFFRFKINFPTFLLFGVVISGICRCSNFHGTLALPRGSPCHGIADAAVKAGGGGHPDGSTAAAKPRADAVETFIPDGVWRTDLKPLCQFSELLLESVVGFHRFLEHFLALLVHQGSGSLVTLDFLALHEVTHDNGGGAGLVS